MPAWQNLGESNIVPILHFSGNFRSYPPLYNNHPLLPEKYFDPELSPDDVKRKVTEGVEPLQYFEFEFYDTFVKKVTYDDGTSVSSKAEDPIVGKEIRIRGLLVDVSPHLIRGRLFAGDIRIVDFGLGKLNLAVQSDLFKTVRKPNSDNGDDEEGADVLSADFESTLYETHDLKNELVKYENSRFIREVGNERDLKIYYNVNSFDFRSLKGKVYGYVGPFVPPENRHDIRVHGRRLLINPTISPELKRDFNIKETDLEPVNDIGRKDLEGSYEIIEEERLAVLRYLNLVPFVDCKHNPPKGYNFSIALLYDGKQIDASPSYPQVNINLKNEDNISRDGGICVFQLPDNIRELDKFRIEVRVKKAENGIPHTFLREPRYDLIFNDDQKFVILESAEKQKEVKVRLYENNKLVKNNDLELILKTEKNNYSPVVALWSDFSARSEKGIASCFMEGINLENCVVGVEDPVLSRLPGSQNPTKIDGELPWDRYYGNYLSLRIQSNEKPTIKVNIPVRVLHRVDPTYLENINGLDKETIQDILIKILSYYTRNYPWLHVQYMYVKDEDGRVKAVYDQFLRLKEYLDFTSRDHIHDWHSVQESIKKINYFLDRLERDDNDWKKMPRSRDFPVNATEFMKAWKASLVHKLVEDIKESKAQIIKDENNDTRNENDLDIDINDWEQVENLVDELENQIGSSSLPLDQKKLMLSSKLAIYNFMLDKLSMTKVQSGHTHNH
jgi:hypothetical protein